LGRPLSAGAQHGVCAASRRALDPLFHAGIRRAILPPVQIRREKLGGISSEMAQFNIRTVDGPRSQKDGRAWATRRLEYSPVLSDRSAYYPEPGVGPHGNLRLPDPGPGIGYLARVSGQRPARASFEMQSAYVLIDAQVVLEAQWIVQISCQMLRVSASNCKHMGYEDIFGLELTPVESIGKRFQPKNSAHYFRTHATLQSYSIPGISDQQRYSDSKNARRSG